MRCMLGRWRSATDRRVADALLRAARMADRDGRRRGDRGGRAGPAVAAGARSRRHRAAAAARRGPAARSAVAPPSAFAESLAEAAQSARLLAAGADSIEALAALVAAFDGCPLKRTATNTVFIDGNPAAPVMIVGEAPGADEDRIGRPFVGRAGQLLDRMLAAIGLDRTRRADHQRRSTGGRPATASRPRPRPPPACPSCCATSRWRGPEVLVLAGGTAAGTLLPVSDGHHPVARPLVRAGGAGSRRAGADPADVPPGLPAARARAESAKPGATCWR